MGTSGAAEGLAFALPRGHESPSPETRLLPEWLKRLLSYLTGCHVSVGLDPQLSLFHLWRSSRGPSLWPGPRVQPGVEFLPVLSLSPFSEEL